MLCHNVDDVMVCHSVDVSAIIVDDVMVCHNVDVSAIIVDDVMVCHNVDVSAIIVDDVMVCRNVDVSAIIVDTQFTTMYQIWLPSVDCTARQAAPPTSPSSTHCTLQCMSRALYLINGSTLSNAREYTPIGEMLL